MTRSSTNAKFVAPQWTTANRPSSPIPGQIGFNTTTNKTETWDGTSWINIEAVTTVTPAAVSDQVNTSTGAFNPPKGTTAQRPGTPEIGGMRWNTDANALEVYTGVGWTNAVTAPYTVSYLLVAGGGGGNQAAGGGAGGVISSTASITVGATYVISIGGGGGWQPYAPGGNGTNSTLGTFATAIGGGGAAASGGSGGGSNDTTRYSGTTGQGYNGGIGAPGFSAGGGGGAGQQGVDGTSSKAGNGGNGIQSSITGTATYYGGGGGAGSNNTSVGLGTGGLGGGGNGGGQAFSVNGTSGLGGTGGGGGGFAGIGNGGAGGSGVCILSIPTSKYSGIYSGTPTVTTSGSNTILTFTSSGSYTG